jgi:hypothetical protein
VKCLPSKRDALNSNPSTEKKKKDFRIIHPTQQNKLFSQKIFFYCFSEVYLVSHKLRYLSTGQITGK